MFIEIIDIPSIDTVSQKITVDFYLSLEWRDHRLEFRDLNKFLDLNALEVPDLQSIWVPAALFR